MTATDELRRLLDERGVEYEGNKDVTRFFGNDGFEVVMQEDIDGKLDCLTPLYLAPEQAIEATLGSDLEAENAKLRERIHELEMEGSDHFYRTAYAEDANRTLEAENARLRELVRKVYHYERFGCQGCPHSGSCGAGTLYDEDCAMSLEIERGKRELGVEVDA